MPYTVATVWGGIWGILLLLGCASQSSEQKGRALAKIYCGSCHQFPNPALLDRVTWEKEVLPVMGLPLGMLDTDHKDRIEQYQQIMAEANYPSRPVLSREAWQQIKNYYITAAPERLELPEREAPIQEQTGLFAMQAVKHTHGLPPSVTCVKIDVQHRKVYASDERAQQLMVFDEEGNLLQNIFQPSAISDINFLNTEQMLLTHIGFSIQPTERNWGFVALLNRTHLPQQLNPATTIISDLHRPVQTLAAGLSGGASEGLITCNYGGQSGGGLSYWQHNRSGVYEEKILKAAPGTIKAEAVDFTGNGNPDILALFAQGDEKIVLFENQGNGVFQEKELLQFPPVYGSVHFETQDFNRDGLLDILYVCGDNADYSNIRKPYHGIYIFINQGGGNFEESFFFSLPGAYKAVARDFDQDGEPDIAAIAYHPNGEKGEEENFIYLGNQSGLVFTPYTLSLPYPGPWMTLEAGDLDGDGDTDLVLGSYVANPAAVQKQENKVGQPGVFYLRNLSGGKTANAQIKISKQKKEERP